MIADGLNKGAIDRSAIIKVLSENLWTQLGDKPCALTCYLDLYNRLSLMSVSAVSAVFVGERKTSRVDKKELCTNREAENKCPTYVFKDRGCIVFTEWSATRSDEDLCIYRTADIHAFK